MNAGCWSAWAALAICFYGTSHASAAEPTAAGVEFFEKSVRPILVQHCYECHAGREANGGLLLDSRDGVMKGGDSGPALVAGDPEKSRLIEAVRYKNPDLQMPPQNRLSAAEVATLERWVKEGAPDPRVGAESSGPAPVGMSIDDGRKFWAFQPVGKPDLPAVQNTAWVRTPIDAFVLARLEAAKLSPAPPADKRTLIRRATFDLTGLPPTPAEVEAFLNDQVPDAFDRVVERLLASPDYGVRWGRHWLDVARYADSNGLDENLAFGNAWRYRDWVVDAFNRDKPYDRFLVEQLAGDLLADANQESRTATGFLVLGAKVLAEPDRDKLDMDTIDEQLDTIGKVFLGMTLGCVRCHDHKFDPLKQTDYYSLAAILKSTKTFTDSKTGAIKHWNEHTFASDAETEENKKVEAAITAKKAAAASFKSKATTKLRDAARAKATEYLMASAKFAPDMPLTQVAAIAEPLGLHPHILHHCRLHLEYHRDDPFFGRWHELVAAKDFDGIDSYYRLKFAAAEAAWAEAKKKDGKAKKLDDEALELARAALYDNAGFLAVPPKPEFAFDDETLAEYHRLSEEARVLESTSPDLPAAMGVTDGKVVNELPIHIRGSHRNLGKAVPRGFPQVMQVSFGSSSGAGTSAAATNSFSAEQSGRLELANWMADLEHPLTARVYVNRIWRWHFGAGIVGSTDNFGQLGDRPTHPELLDWLARHFATAGWSTKDLHRLIMRSNTYQMASRHPREAECAVIDPENKLLWKWRQQRLEAEEIRDAILAVSGRLEQRIGGKTVPLRNRQFVFDHTSIDRTKYDSLRRAVYLPVIRNNLYTLFEQFDFPDPTVPTGNRNCTVVAPQALWMLNAELVMDSADVWARRLLDTEHDPASRVRRAYYTAFGRAPTRGELDRALKFVAQLRGASTDDARRAAAAELHAWALLCHGLLASNEFIYVR
ncbi:MAG: PSD1 domain-containing protein [Planctomycetes bacterium]|nr:PSD1 domain-containing protein [Planctomycetota bacterium]